MTDDRTPGAPHSGDTKDRGTETDRASPPDRTLTEQEEDKAGGANRKTPGPLYDL